ncbi:GNAT family N-acetyltransferase [Kiloniella antarctica]|uniref:GNAT family N-acetyltransferase n=1 Tax=Kiloniella antarctica TaxID=1550907 RepID=A0ABW5BGS5_9PROT
MSSTILETDRLRLRELCEADAPFILELLNDPTFIQNIVDKGVRNIDQACDYINNGPIKSYQQNGFGLYLTELKKEKAPIGMCGLVKRDGLEHPDIGYALLPAFWSKGYAYESAAAMLEYAKTVLQLPRVVGITNPENVASVRILEKIGLKFERIINLGNDMPDTKYYS